MRVRGKGQDISCEPQAMSYELLAGRERIKANGLLLTAIIYLLFPLRSKLIARSLQFLACSFLFLFSAAAQQVSATIDRDKILLGEQVTLQLKAEEIRTEDNPIVAWFNLPDTINHLEVVKRSAI